MFKKNIVGFDRIQKYITYFIVLTLIIALIVEFANKRWDFFFVTILATILIFIPYFFQKRYRIYLPSELQLAIILFIYAGVFLGEVQNFYFRYWWWDSLLHVFSGFALSLIAFGVMYVLYKTEKIKTSPVFICVIIFSISLAFGAIWEIFEFGMDSVFGTNMQKSRDLCPNEGYCNTRLGVIDTMIDFILDAIGALFASILGYIYLKKGDQFLLNGIINKFVDRNPDLFYK
ncbi:MAG: hypothetical protein PHU47_02240 [Candidatus ainarchaeum sp.]|nr:hypothetical protein [Candidatus ainarchaeum sp.]